MSVIFPTRHSSDLSTGKQVLRKEVADKIHIPERNVIKSGIFWDIENIPVKKSIAAKRIPELKTAIINFVTKINHYDEERPPVKEIAKFLAVARQQGENQCPTTSDLVKSTLLKHEIELLDLPYCRDPDYCDDAIYHSVLYFTRDYDKCIVVALTGDIGLVRRINNIKRDFDLIVVMQRAGKKHSVMQNHCDKIKQTNERGRQQAVYFIDEVIRKCIAGSVPLTFSQLLRLNNSRTNMFDESLILEDNHLRLLYSEQHDTDTETDCSSVLESIGSTAAEKVRYYLHRLKETLTQCSASLWKSCMSTGSARMAPIRAD